MRGSIVAPWSSKGSIGQPVGHVRRGCAREMQERGEATDQVRLELVPTGLESKQPDDKETRDAENEKELEIEIVRNKRAELERQSALLARLSAEIEEISAGPPASGKPQSSGGLKRSERDSQLIRVAAARGSSWSVGNQLRRPWSQGGAGDLRDGAVTHIVTLAVTDKEAATPDAAQVQRDAILAGEVLEWAVDKAPPRKRWDEDREPTRDCAWWRTASWSRRCAGARAAKH